MAAPNRPLRRWNFCPIDGTMLQPNWNYCTDCGLEIGPTPDHTAAKEASENMQGGYIAGLTSFPLHPQAQRSLSPLGQDLQGNARTTAHQYEERGAK